MADLTTNDQVDQALAILDAGDDAGKSAEDQILAKLEERPEAGDSKPDQDAGETAPDTTAEAVEAETPVEKTVADPPIEAPASWKAEEKERFKALPPDLQKYLTERESERERGLSKSQQESADARKAAEAERTAVQDERKAYASRLNVLIDIANTIDPVIAEGQKTDWAKLHKDDPLNAPAKWFEYQARRQQLNALQAERDQVLQNVKHQNYQVGDKALREKLDFWADDGKRKAFQSDFAKYLTEQGFKAEEAGGIEDYRAILLGRKAMLYDQLMAQQSKIAATKVAPTHGKVVRPQSNETTGKNARAEALTKRALKSGRTDDAVDAIMSAIG